jgi:hypothetical protein
MRLSLVLMAAPLWAQLPECACPSAALQPARDGIAAHQKRNLGEASTQYTLALQAAPSRAVTAAEKDLILRFAPRVFVNHEEPFPLKDAAAILHPERPWIAYHFFWEDDIDFPDDNDPSDHEVVWVRLDDSRQRLVGFYTYFHGRILEAPPEALQDAQAHGGRVKLEVQWGKHGSLPVGWRGMREVEENQRTTWQRLVKVGRDSRSSELARGWPMRFAGTWEQWMDASKPVDLVAVLRTHGLMKVSWLNNAVINRQFLRYNFAAKTEWPDRVCER